MLTKSVPGPSFGVNGWHYLLVSETAVDAAHSDWAVIKASGLLAV